MRVLAVVAGVVVLGAGTLAFAGTSSAASVASGAKHAAPASNSRSARVAYQGCPAKDVELTVVLSARSYGLGQAVHYVVRLHNLGAKSCAGGSPPPSSLRPGQSGPLPSIGLGPCDSLPVTVRNARGAQVFPTTGNLACPVLMGPSLAAHATLRTSGTWDRVEGALRPARIPAPAPPGRYRLVVDGVLSVPFTLTNAPPAAAVSAPTTHAGLVPTARSGHVAFGGCPARSVTMTVTIAPNTGADTAVARVTVHNASAAWCGPHRHTGSLILGPCGEISAVVHDATGADVYPGNELFFCPAYRGRGVAPHSSASGTFRWTGEEDLAPTGVPARWQQAPAGRYSLDVGGVLKVPFTLPG